MMVGTVVSLGDSVSAGVGDRGSDSLGWTSYLAAALGAQTYSNLARIGARARDVRYQQLPQLGEMRPNIATILVGGNDALRKDFRPTRIGDDVAEVCADLGARGTAVIVVLLHDPSRVLPKGGGVFGRVIAARARCVNISIRSAVAGIPGALVLDPSLEEWTYERSTWHFDYMHPSAAGHRRLAQSALELVESHGYARVGSIPDIPADRISRIAQARWLIRNGAPWFAKRSVDLVPELVRVVLAERKFAADALA
jgi:lysophospholipase L1-like esterase